MQPELHWPAFTPAFISHGLELPQQEVGRNPSRAF